MACRASSLSYLTICSSPFFSIYLQWSPLTVYGRSFRYLMLKISEFRVLNRIFHEGSCLLLSSQRNEWLMLNRSPVLSARCGDRKRMFNSNTWEKTSYFCLRRWMWPGQSHCTQTMDIQQTHSGFWEGGRECSYLGITILLLCFLDSDSWYTYPLP